MIGFFTDVQIPSAITDGLRLRDVYVRTAQEDGSRRLSDSKLLDRATELRLILFTQDTDFLNEAAARQRNRVRFGGVIYAAQKDVTTGTCIDDLELIAKTEDIDDWIDRVEYLPLK